MPFVAADGKDVLIYQVDGCEHKVMAGTFDRLVKQLAGEEKPGEGRAGVGSCTHACWVVLVCCFFITLLSPSSLLPFPSLLHPLPFSIQPDSHYVTIFLYGMRHFAKPVDVAAKLIRRYPSHSVNHTMVESTC